MKVNTQVQRPQLQTYRPPNHDDPAGYSYQNHLQATPGDSLAEIREAGFEELTRLGKHRAYAGVGGAVTKGVAFGLAVTAGVRLMAAASGNGSVAGAVVVGCLATGSYLGSRALDQMEARADHQIQHQVHFMGELDEAQLQLTGIPADPWIFI